MGVRSPKSSRIGYTEIPLDLDSSLTLAPMTVIETPLKSSVADRPYMKQYSLYRRNGVHANVIPASLRKAFRTASD